MEISLILIVLFVVIALLLGLVVLVSYFASLWRHREREARSLDSVLLQVRVPRGNEIKIDAMEQVVSALYSIKKGGWRQRFSTQPVIGFEIVAQTEQISFYVWTFKKYQDLVEKQIHGGYPDAEIRQVPEYNIFTKDGKVAHKSLQLRADSIYPIKTYQTLPTDPLSAITSALAKMGKDEAAGVQVLISPADSSWQRSASGFVSSTKKDESDPEKASFKVPAKTLESVEAKAGKPGFQVFVNLVVVSPTLEAARVHLGNIEGTFAQFNGELNGFKSKKFRNKAVVIENFLYRYQPIFYPWSGKASILNSEEIATVFHFPNRLITTPHIDWLNAKTAPAPAQIPKSGLFLGKSRFRGTERDVYISDSDRMRHMYIIGRTGTGKSEILKDLIMQDVADGHGLCFMDPHGDAVEEVLEMIPPERAEDVIYFKPSDVGRPMGLNLLEARSEDQKHFISTAVINMFYKLFDPYKTGIVGPRFEHAVRNAMLTAMSEEGSTFVEVMRILTDSRYVQEILPKVSDPIVRRYWTDQIAQTSDFHKSETLDYITSKFGRFVTNKMMRNIIGQSSSSFNFREVMDSGKVLLINLSKGELGEENSNFLGLILVPRILMAAMSRADTPKDKRRNFYFYVDEFQNFATPDFSVILSEARKYSLGLTVANQFIGQVDEEVKNAVFGNVGTLVSFRVGVTDANYLAHEFSPTFTEDDLLNIERYHVYIKTIVNDEPQPPFSMDLTKDMAAQAARANSKIAEVIKEMSRLRYGRDARLVEAEIARRAKL